MATYTERPGTGNNKDTYVAEHIPATDASTVTILITDSTGGTETLSYIGFLLTENIVAGSVINTATLELWRTFVGGAFTDRVEPINGSWVDTIVWNDTQPAIGTAQDDQETAGANAKATFDVKVHVQEIIDNQYLGNGFRLSSVGGTAHWFRSGNNPGNSPRVTVDFTPPGVMTLGHDVGWPQTGMVLGERKSRGKKRRDRR